LPADADHRDRGQAAPAPTGARARAPVRKKANIPLIDPKWARP
jgi:hypothetical protein